MRASPPVEQLVVLRRFQHFLWLSPRDIAEATGDKEREVSIQCYFLYSSGFLRRRGWLSRSYRYSITPAGRAILAAWEALWHLMAWER